MRGGYEEEENARFRTVFANGREEIWIPARRNWFALLFLPFWLIPWTIGGGVAIYQLIATGDLFVAVWLCFWAAGWLFAAGTLAWMIAGIEVVAVSGGDLEIGFRLLGYARSRRYRGGGVSHLEVSTAVNPFRSFQGSLPFAAAMRFGTVKFDYGARTIAFAASLDEAEGRLIVDWLRRRLPTAAADS